MYLCIGTDPGRARLGDPRERSAQGPSETVARCATLGWSLDVCQEFWFTVEGQRCVVSTGSPFKRLGVNEEDEQEARPLEGHPMFVLTDVYSFLESISSEFGGGDVRA